MEMIIITPRCVRTERRLSPETPRHGQSVESQALDMTPIFPIFYVDKLAFFCFK